MSRTEAYHSKHSCPFAPASPGVMHRIWSVPSASSNVPIPMFVASVLPGGCMGSYLVPHQSALCSAALGGQNWSPCVVVSTCDLLLVILSGVLSQVGLCWNWGKVSLLISLVSITNALVKSTFESIASHWCCSINNFFLSALQNSTKCISETLHPCHIHLPTIRVTCNLLHSWEVLGDSHRVSHCPRHYTYQLSN